METHDLKSLLRNALLDFLWDQWVSLGMAGNASGKPVPFIIDPEALLLATLRFAIDENRFRGELLDWLQHNGALLSVQRVKNLQLNCKVADAKPLRGIAKTMEAQGYPNWKSIRSEHEPEASTDFSKHVPRGMSQAPDPGRKENFILRLRLLFGVNARAEIIAWFLTHVEGHAAHIARDTAWFPKSVQAILNDLEHAGMLHSQTDGKKKTFRLSSRAPLWHPDFGTKLRWLNQGFFYTGLIHLENALDAIAHSEASASAKAIAIRRHLPFMTSAFRLAGLDSLFSITGQDRSEVLVDEFLSGCRQLVQLIESRRPIGSS